MPQSRSRDYHYDRRASAYTCYHPSYHYNYTSYQYSDFGAQPNDTIQNEPPLAELLDGRAKFSWEAVLKTQDRLLTPPQYLLACDLDRKHSDDNKAQPQQKSQPENDHGKNNKKIIKFGTYEEYVKAHQLAYLLRYFFRVHRDAWYTSTKKTLQTNLFAFFNLFFDVFAGRFVERLQEINGNHDSNCHERKIAMDCLPKVYVWKDLPRTHGLEQMPLPLQPYIAFTRPNPYTEMSRTAILLLPCTKNEEKTHGETHTETLEETIREEALVDKKSKVPNDDNHRLLQSLVEAKGSAWRRWSWPQHPRQTLITVQEGGGQDEFLAVIREAYQQLSHSRQIEEDCEGILRELRLKHKTCLLCGQRYAKAPNLSFSPSFSLSPFPLFSFVYLIFCFVLG